MQQSQQIQPLQVKGISILEHFDISQQQFVGRPYYFNLDQFIITVEMLICADEIQTALYLLDNPPGWYRDHYPAELRAIKDRIYQQSYDQFDYANDADEAGFTREQVSEQCLTQYTYPRADILFNDLKELNAKDKVPWIFEISPSHGWLPVGFKDRGIRFDYYGKNINQPALAKVMRWMEQEWLPKPHADQLKILVCYESIEHMPNPHDFIQAAHKIGESFDFIYASVPMYTLCGGLPDWKTRRIGHVRTWTPREFLRFLDQGFPGYKWQPYLGHSMVFKGMKS